MNHIFDIIIPKKSVVFYDKLLHLFHERLLHLKIVAHSDNGLLLWRACLIGNLFFLLYQALSFSPFYTIVTLALQNRGNRHLTNCA